VVIPCDQRIHHYDTDGVTWDHLMTENNEWLGAIMVPFSSSSTWQRSCDEVIANLTAQASWSAERCAPRSHDH